MTKIFIVEDESFMGKMYQLNLKKKGYELTQLFGDGVGVLDAVRIQKPNLILLDMVMPNKNGFDVIKEVRADESLASTQIMVITNLRQAEDIAEIKRLGANYYIDKTQTSFSEVLTMIEQIVPLQVDV